MARRYAQRLSAALVLAVVGCGGGGGGNGGGSSTGGSGSASVAPASGRVVLPPGSKLSLAGCTVASGIDQAAVKPDGTFQLNTVGTGPGLATLTNSAGQVLLLGYVDSSPSGSPMAGGHGEISAQQTAAALLFIGLGGVMLPGQDWLQALTQIEQAPQTTALANVIASRVAADPLALSDGDQQIVTTLQNTENALQPPGKTVPRPVGTAATRAVLHVPREPGAPALSRVATIAVTRGATRAGGYKVFVQNAGEQSGVEVLPTSDNSGINFVNHFRRRAAAFVYEVATADANGNRTDKKPAVPMKFSQNTVLAALLTADYPSVSFNAQEDYYELAPAIALNGWAGSITNAAGNQYAWQAATTGPVALPPDGSLPTTTYYDVIVVGPSPDPVSSSSVLTDPEIAGFHTDWEQTISVLNVEEFIEDFVFAVVSNIGLGMKEQEQLPWNQQALPASAIEDFNAFLGGLGDLNKSVQSGDLAGALKALLQQAADAGVVQGKIADLFISSITVTYVPGSPFNAQTFEQRFAPQLARLGKLLAVLDATLNMVDICEMERDRRASAPVALWNVAVTGEPVSITPPNPTVSAEAPSTTLTAVIEGFPNPTQFRFAWSVSGNLGSLFDMNTGQPIPSGQTGNDEVNFVASTGAASGMSSTVTVTVYDPANGDQVYGIAHTTVDYVACGSSTRTTHNSTTSVTFDKSVVHSGDTITATVVFKTGPAGVFGGIFVRLGVDVLANDMVGTWTSVDGGPASDIYPGTNQAFPGSVFVVRADKSGTVQETHTVKFKVGTIATASCSGVLYATGGNDPNWFPPSAGGTGTGWVTFGVLP